jgi:glycerol uptake facilitator-like aquaporin
MTPQSISRRIGAEALGTALLLATVVGSGIMAERLADGNVAIALLGNTLPTGAMLIVLILVFGPISGAHLNPAVSLAFALRGELKIRMLALYATVQIVAAVLGVMLAHAMFDLPLVAMGDKIRTGPSQWLSESVATFGLVLTILAVAKVRPGMVAFAVGLYISAAYWFTASTSFANPAVTLARALTDTFSGIRMRDAFAFVVAQALGSILAVACFRWLFAALPSHDRSDSS